MESIAVTNWTAYFVVGNWPPLSSPSLGITKHRRQVFRLTSLLMLAVLPQESSTKFDICHLFPFLLFSLITYDKSSPSFPFVIQTCFLRGIDPFQTDANEVMERLRSWVACSLADSGKHLRLHSPFSNASDSKPFLSCEWGLPNHRSYNASWSIPSSNCIHVLCLPWWLTTRTYQRRSK